MRTDINCKNVYDRFWHPRWCVTDKPKIMSLSKKLPKIGSSDYYCFVVTRKVPHTKPPSRESVVRLDIHNSGIREFGIREFLWQEVFSKRSCLDKLNCFYRHSFNGGKRLKTFLAWLIKISIGLSTSLMVKRSTPSIPYVKGSRLLCRSHRLDISLTGGSI